MRNPAPYTINLKGRLLDLSKPRVMGILNVTPDSFYSASRSEKETAIIERASQILAEDGDIIDIGAYSTRPGCGRVSVEEELSRMRLALGAVRRVYPEAVVSVDTFRPVVARMAVEEYGADIINDVSEGGAVDEGGFAGDCEGDIFAEAGRLGVPFILMSVKPTVEEMVIPFGKEIERLRGCGVKDIIIDPGFGFGKTVDQNYKVLANLEKLHVFGLPLLAGVSRKRLVYQVVGGDASTALNGTTVINTVALMSGASLLRVHDVREAVETVKIVSQMS